MAVIRGGGGDYWVPREKAKTRKTNLRRIQFPRIVFYTTGVWHMIYRCMVRTQNGELTCVRFFRDLNFGNGSDWVVRGGKHGRRSAVSAFSEIDGWGAPEWRIDGFPRDPTRPRRRTPSPIHHFPPERRLSEFRFPKLTPALVDLMGPIRLGGPSRL